MSSPLPTETNKPLIALLCVLSVALIVAAIFMANRPEPPPPLPPGTVYYTGPMVGKGQLGRSAMRGLGAQENPQPAPAPKGGAAAAKPPGSTGNNGR